MLEDARLRIFAAVAREGSFTQAARRLGITQPAVSQNIAELERILGTELFERSRGSVRLTAAGTSLMEYAGKILHWYSAIGDLFGEKGRLGSSGPLKIMADDFVASCVLPSVLLKSIASGKRVSFNVCESEAGEYDLRFRTMPHKEVLSLDESAGYVGLVAGTAVTSNRLYSGISDLQFLPASVRFAVWKPYSSLLPIDIQMRTDVRSSSLKLIGSLVAADPQTIGLLPLEAAPSGLSIMPAAIRRLDLDLFIEHSEGFGDNETYNSLRNLAMEARKSDL